MSKIDTQTIGNETLQKSTFSHNFGVCESAFADRRNPCWKIPDQVYFNCTATQLIAA